MAAAVEEHVGRGGADVVLVHSMHMAIIEAPPLAIRHFAVGIVVAATHASKVIAHSVQVVHWGYILCIQCTF